MRGKLVKKLRRAARELVPADAPERALTELTGTRRHQAIKVRVKDNETGKDKFEDATRVTYSAINHPNSVRGRFRLLKRAYKLSRGPNV